MKKRKVDHKLLKSLIQESESRTTQGTAEAMRVSWSFIKKLVSGKYPFEVKERFRKTLCQHLRANEDVLFPFVEETEFEQAS